MHIIHLIFGQGDELGILQMCARAFVLYFVTILLLRISGTRTFGKNSAFDNIVAIMLGAVLSRALVGASPFIPTIGACLVLVIMHRVLAMLSIYIKGLGRIIKGHETVLYKDGKILNENLKNSLLTDGDLMESVRLNANLNSLDKVEQIVMERSGQLSVVTKQPVKE